MTCNGFGSRLPVTAKALRPAVFAAAVLALGACGGGGGSPSAPTTPGPGTPPGSGGDPRLARLAAVLERADALLFSDHRLRWSLSGGGESQNGDTAEPIDCAGARCVTGDGVAVTVADLAAPAEIAIGPSKGSLGSRGGFDSYETSVRFELTESIPGVTATTGATMLSYGFWGAHGFAALEIGEGRLTGQVDGTAFTGSFSLARAWAAGAVSGSNPAGRGSAVWRGIAEVSPTDAFERLTGMATVRIADLSRPRVSVAIDVPGHEIGAPGWADMALANGGFSTGTAGRDYLAGNLHGPEHEEAWGVFDTEAYIGAFGARRGP